jgi:pimeloyl-[acyl-carrier protein] methyl ester esterase
MECSLVNLQLYSEVGGEGTDVILLHGWGMHGAIWGEFKNHLSKNLRIHALDLPGYGFSRDMSGDFNLESLSEVVENYVLTLNKTVVLLGWSLGGLIALNILKRKNVDVAKVIFIASTPCFTKKNDWPDAIEQSVFDSFENDIGTDYKKTLQRFLSLQTRGSELDRESLRMLKSNISERGEPDIQALKSGLKILRDADLRDEVTEATPALVILGEKDTLVPVSVKNEFAKQFSNSEIIIINKAAHAPFISHPDICALNIKNFINERK